MHDDPTAPPGAHRARTSALALGALGVVFGDIGTSPLYTLQMATGDRAIAGREADVLGVLSLMFWGIVLVVAVKYVTFIMRAENRGEGGILALLAIIPERVTTRVGWIAPLVLAGAALLFGDGLITPAISVLSAVEGLKLVAPTTFTLPVIVGITVAILFGLFALQRRGTSSIGALFGPVMLLWFVVIGALGLVQVVRHPFVLEALAPTHAVGWFVRHGWEGVPILGIVVLCLTGGEALYADMGHFGARPIRVAWFAVAMPALVLCYLGQGALLLSDPSAQANPFFSLAPAGAPMVALVVLATAATIIASQALITGVFSLTKQAVALGYSPRLTIRHTSRETEGQVYLPEVNWGLAAGCIALVLVFHESSALAAAFGIAVSGTMAITSIAYYVVLRQTWGWSRARALPLLLLFLSFDLPFLGANLLKFAEGGYIPVAIGLAVFAVMLAWKRGRSALGEHRRRSSVPLDEFLATLDQRIERRVPGTAVFLSSLPGTIPPGMAHHVARIHVLHERVALFSITIARAPHVPPDERLVVERLPQGFVSIVARLGYLDEPEVPALVADAERRHGLGLDVAGATYYVGHETFLRSSRGVLGPLAEGVFAFLARNAVSATAAFKLPNEQVMEIGSQIDL